MRYAITISLFGNLPLKFDGKLNHAILYISDHIRPTSKRMYFCIAKIALAIPHLPSSLTHGLCALSSSSSFPRAPLPPPTPWPASCHLLYPPRTGRAPLGLPAPQLGSPCHRPQACLHCCSLAHASALRSACARRTWG